MPATASPRRTTVSDTFRRDYGRQPLAWMEAGGLPDEALALGPEIGRYKEVQHDFHSGVILPVGDEPSGRSWTGFQSLNGDRGYFIFFREQHPDRRTRIGTWLPEGATVRLTPVLGSGKPPCGRPAAAESWKWNCRRPTTMRCTAMR